MKKFFASVLVVLTASVTFAKDPAANGIDIKGTDHKGVPTFVTGNIGHLGNGAPDQAAKAFLKANVGSIFGAVGTEDFDAKSVTSDALGQTHVKLQQTLRGLPVIGGELIVHSDRTGNVVAINGRFAADRDLPRAPKMDSRAAVEKAAAQAGITNWQALGNPTLTYVVNEKSNAFLAWVVRASYNNGGPQIDKIYADATTGDLVQKSPEYYYAKSRSVYSANNGTSLPGTLKISEGGALTGDAAIDAAYNYSGNVYDFYMNVHGRNSYDNAGATMKSSAHYSTSYNNAFWNGTQMVYGDGDGTQFIALSRALDVDAHELTHAVTERTANLNYSNESGALNEANSDIQGNSTEAYTRNGWTPDAATWQVGEDIYTPGTAGDALRSMSDPAINGDYDWYPTRYTGTADNGGVHSNSGIGNLAFNKMVMGGTHPRGKSTVNVTPLSATSGTSMQMASKIWYRALTVYMTSTTNFAGARTATSSAATDLYGAAAAATVNQAWDCVGVPGGTGGGGTTTLSNGVAVSSLSGATGSFTGYKITVPTGQTQLQIVMSGGTGDADMYVKRGSAPTKTVYDYRPYLTGNNETVTVTNPVAGDWYINLDGYAAYSGVTLKATYSGTAPPPPGCTSYSGSLSGTGVSQIQPNGTYYQSTISGTHTAKLTGPASGADFDLYLLKWNGSAWAQVAASESATANENISYAGTSGYYEWKVLSYSGSGSYTLCTTKP
ncbi:MAG TPA: M4 family metallopeptidase [Thermoanaerobaculia bacterium]|nr:M4 family metallopeptidase [Thermoanaerobaculia bacterium]